MIQRQQRSQYHPRQRMGSGNSFGLTYFLNPSADADGTDRTHAHVPDRDTYNIH
jgi:hypothetical protein